jgi:hypothetical protein
VSPIKAVSGRRGRKVMLIAWAVIIAGCLIVAGYVIGSAPGQIQQQRAEAVNCREQNARHDAAITELDRLIRLLPLSRRARAVQGRDGTVALIEALAPKRDCSALVRRTVNDPPAQQ